MTTAQLRENWLIALESIRSQKGRTFLTVLGVVVGVAAVIAVAAIIEGLNRDIVSRVQQLGSKVFFVGRFPPGQTPDQWTEETRRRKKFETRYARLINEQAPSVEYAAVFADASFAFGYENEVRFRNESVTSFFLRGVDENFPLAVPMFATSEGRMLTAADNARARPVTMLGQGVASALFGPLDPVGRTVRLNGLPFEVIGVLEHDEGLFGGPGVDDFVIIPLGKFEKLFPEVEMRFLAVSVADTANLPRAVDETVAVLRRERGVAPQDPDDFDVTLPDFLEQLWSQLTSALFLLTFAVSSIALIVGGIGVMNIMLVSVTERTREIGIRKAVGARSADIRAQFLIEALALTSVGGVLGVAAGGLASWGISAAVPTFTAYLSPAWIATGLGVSGAVGLFFGYYPATQAARLDPIESLRHE